MDIPDDIMKTARELRKFMLREGVSEHDIARAILAEREACISLCRRLAEHQKERGQFQDAFTSNFIADNLQASAHKIPNTPE